MLPERTISLNSNKSLICQKLTSNIYSNKWSVFSQLWYLYGYTLHKVSWAKSEAKRELCIRDSRVENDLERYSLKLRIRILIHYNYLALRKWTEKENIPRRVCALWYKKKTLKIFEKIFPFLDFEKIEYKISVCFFVCHKNDELYVFLFNEYQIPRGHFSPSLNSQFAMLL